MLTFDYTTVKVVIILFYLKTFNKSSWKWDHDYKLCCYLLIVYFDENSNKCRVYSLTYSYNVNVRKDFCTEFIYFRLVLCIRKCYT